MGGKGEQSSSCGGGGGGGPVQVDGLQMVLQGELLGAAEQGAPESSGGMQASLVQAGDTLPGKIPEFPEHSMKPEEHFRGDHETWYIRASERRN